MQNKSQIKIVGLGYYDENTMSLGAYNAIKEKKKILVRTINHPTVDYLKKMGIEIESFDSYYEKYDSFEEVYKNIAKTVLERAKDEDIVYAVPGSPSVAESTVTLLKELKDDKTKLEIIESTSFLDPCFKAASIDPVDGFILLDAYTMDSFDLDPSKNTFITQVALKYLLTNTKLSLMEIYKDDHEVMAIYDAGSPSEKIIKLKVYELDRILEESYRMTLFVPKSDSKNFEKLIKELSNFDKSINKEITFDDEKFSNFVTDLISVISEKDESYDEWKYLIEDILLRKKSEF